MKINTNRIIKINYTPSHYMDLSKQISWEMPKMFFLLPLIWTPNVPNWIFNNFFLPFGGFSQKKSRLVLLKANFSSKFSLLSLFFQNLFHSLFLLAFLWLFLSIWQNYLSTVSFSLLFFNGEKTSFSNFSFLGISCVRREEEFSLFSLSI